MEVSLQWPWGKLTVHESCEIPVDLSGSSTIDNLTITNKQLVGGWPTPLKNMKVTWDDYSQ